MRLIIVGGVAGGMSAATRARRLDEKARSSCSSRGRTSPSPTAACPTSSAGPSRERDRLLVVTPARLRSRFNIDVRTRSEVTEIDPTERRVTVRDLEAGRTYTETYDKLILAPGAEPVRPPIPGLDDPEVFTLRNLQDMDRIHAAAETAVGERRALVIGGGFIGLEMAENLAHRGFRVAVAEMLPQVMPPIDPEMAAPVHRHLAREGRRPVPLQRRAVRRAPGRGAAGHARRTAACSSASSSCCASASGRTRPWRARRGWRSARPAASASTSTCAPAIRAIYAVGDAVESIDYVTRRPVLVPLAGPANRQGRIAADNVCGRDAMFRGVQGTAIVKVFDLTVANTGASEKTLARLGIPFQKVYVHPSSRAGYYPGSGDLTVKLLFAPDDGRVLGAQIVGTEGVDKRIDVLATAIQAHMTVFDLEEAELAYAPPYGSAKDPVNMVGFVAANTLRGDVDVVHADAVPEEMVLLDVRTPGEFAAGHVPGALNVPLDEIRGRLDEVPKDRPLAVYCGVGLRAYLACRILDQEGFKTANLSGGLKTCGQFHPKPSPEADELRKAFTVDGGVGEGRRHDDRAGVLPAHRAVPEGRLHPALRGWRRARNGAALARRGPAGGRRLAGLLRHRPRRAGPLHRLRPRAGRRRPREQPADDAGGAGRPRRLGPGGHLAPEEGGGGLLRLQRPHHRARRPPGRGPSGRRYAATSSRTSPPATRPTGPSWSPAGGATSTCWCWRPRAWSATCAWRWASRTTA